MLRDRNDFADSIPPAGTLFVPALVTVALLTFARFIRAGVAMEEEIKGTCEDTRRRGEHSWGRCIAHSVHLDRLLAERQMTLSELSGLVGVTVANLSILKNGHARAIRFSTLAALCEVLDCQPGDLLTWEPGKRDELER